MTIKCLQYDLYGIKLELYTFSPEGSVKGQRQIHTLQSRDYHGYLEGNKRRLNGDEQRPARGIADFQYDNRSTITILDHKCSNKISR